MLLKVWERIWRLGLPAYCLTALYAAGYTVSVRFRTHLVAKSPPTRGVRLRTEGVEFALSGSHGYEQEFSSSVIRG
jgi:hypothetical protein